ncbi:DNA-binding protein [Aliiruegeria lutimaris]|uniref:Helix-turn-helix domain-containing protein n=1 Tax=Aliiruegeria lutimaris TaxID=571298 RepID=A0A1G9MDH0_9RHOB|nr:DNA-binding protein [Aliiruegeria lutimaris]SDL72249.1 hypothetical protein SAMN04488026_11092 [Aliiruegeria lutimaris]
MMTGKPITPKRFDALTTGPEKLWGLEAIAEALGVSVNKARRLAKLPSWPIYKPEGSGTWFAFRSELMAKLTGN